MDAGALPRPGPKMRLELDPTCSRIPTITILAQGLKPMRRHHVHLSPDVETATKVGARRGAPVILAVRAAALEQDGHAFWLTSNQVWLTGHVPPEFIERLS